MTWLDFHLFTDNQNGRQLATTFFFYLNIDCGHIDFAKPPYAASFAYYANIVITISQINLGHGRGDRVSLHGPHVMEEA